MMPCRRYFVRKFNSGRDIPRSGRARFDLLVKGPGGHGSTRRLPTRRAGRDPLRGPYAKDVSILVAAIGARARILVTQHQTLPFGRGSADRATANADRGSPRLARIAWNVK